MFWRIKAYDSDNILDAIASMKAVPLIPPRSNHKIRRTYDREIYKCRNIVECTFNKLKHWRRLSTRLTVKPFTSRPSYIWLQQLYGFKCRFDLEIRDPTLAATLHTKPPHLPDPVCFRPKSNFTGHKLHRISAIASSADRPGFLSTS